MHQMFCNALGYVRFSDSGGLPDRSVSLTGPPDAIQYVCSYHTNIFFFVNLSFDLQLSPPRKAKMLLDDIVSRGRGTPPSFHESTNGNGHMQEMIIPAGKAGLIIGKGGETIKQLQVESCVPSDPPAQKCVASWSHGFVRAFQERAGVKMILIQDASQGANIDKPLRIIGDPYKVQVRAFFTWYKCYVHRVSKSFCFIILQIEAYFNHVKYLEKVSFGEVLC